MPDVVLGLGSNLGDPEANLREALERLSAVLDVAAVSDLYRTEPVGLREQPTFLNAVLIGAVSLDPRALLREIARIEDAMGRERGVAMGPRTIDIDLLLYGDEVHDAPNLVVPHPRMATRRFVLAPLAEIAPGLRLPDTGRGVAELLDAIGSGEAVERMSVPGWPPGGRPI